MKLKGSKKLVSLCDFIETKEKPEKDDKPRSSLHNNKGKNSGVSLGLSTLLHFNHNETISSIRSKYGQKSEIS